MDYRAISDDVAQKVMSYHQDPTGWKVAKYHKRIIVTWKPSKDYLGKIFRGEGIVEELPEKVVPFIYLPEYRNQWDKDMKSYSILEHIDQDTEICHTITDSYGKGVLPTREFVDLVHIRRYDEGVITINCISVNYEKSPDASSHGRSFNNPCGFVCSPLPMNPAHTKLVMYVQPDLGGLLPRFAVESMLPTNMVTIISDLRDGLRTLNQGS